ncbi:response regulator [Paenibacillus thalictri]|uniref:Response regulator transcription factor n=1 Tax=Paenibacillus thalictri TaxID=2527873 RepID=A0A4Q9DQ27_9BACL|nr:response regulator transcription factor [Paenibacillus thalictri]TBL76086.1 response regulator transcription factor [Paenibacillus thalictri]
MEEPLQNIRILLVDDQTMIRQGLGYVIRLQPDMEVVGEAADGEAAVERCLASKPDVVLMDVQMPKLTGIEAAKQIIDALPDTKIVILTTFDVQEYVYEGIRAGAVGYLLKDADSEDMLQAIRSAYRGEAVYRTAKAGQALSDVLSERETGGLTAAYKEHSDACLLEPLTGRELEVLQQMAYGLRNDQIAVKLTISEGTVKAHVHRILQKLAVDDRTQAVVYAIRQGMVQ